MRTICCGLGLALFLSTGCTGTSPLLCSNDLDGSEFGFLLTVPASYECSTVLKNPTSLANVGYRDTAAGRTASVQVNSPQNGSVGEGVESEDLGDTTNSHGFTFERQKLTFENIGVSYVGGTTLPGDGNLLFITVSGSEDSDELLDTLNEIIATVQASN